VVQHGVACVDWLKYIVQWSCYDLRRILSLSHFFLRLSPSLLELATQPTYVVPRFVWAANLDTAYMYALMRVVSSKLATQRQASLEEVLMHPSQFMFPTF
jgi:hypothetical protein